MLPQPYSKFHLFKKMYIKKRLICICSGEDGKGVVVPSTAQSNATSGFESREAHAPEDFSSGPRSSPSAAAAAQHVGVNRKGHPVNGIQGNYSVSRETDVTENEFNTSHYVRTEGLQSSEIVTRPESDSLPDQRDTTLGVTSVELLCPLRLEPLSVGGRVLPCDDHNPCPPEHFCLVPAEEAAQNISPFCCPIPKQIGKAKNIPQCILNMKIE